jgi:uncharacterized phage protein gp47/JayE
VKSFEDFMSEMLSNIPENLKNQVDTREGSIIYTALAPMAAMYGENRYYADNVQDTTMPDTALGDDLTRCCAQEGVNRYPASKAIRKGTFTSASDGSLMDVPIGSLFGAEGIFYKVTAKTAAGIYELECQQPGIVGNSYFGAILPIDNIEGLGTATLSDVLTAGEEEEADEALRTRYFQEYNEKPYGGNIADYKQKILGIPGVGDVKIFPTPNNQGGRVHCVIVDPDEKPVSETLLNTVENIIDPEPKGKGYGLAPIDHYVTISTVSELTIDIEISAALRAGVEISGIQSSVEAAITEYLNSLAFKDNVVRAARIEAAVLGVDGIADISSTLLNGSPDNITLPSTFDNYQVPAIGSVTIAEADNV